MAGKRTKQHHRLGNDFYANRNLTIQCEKQILFGDNDLLGWNVSVRDTDGHRIYGRFYSLYIYDVSGR